MQLLAESFDLLTKDGIISLKDNQVPEGKELDYKLKLSFTTDAEKKEFLADVSSFSNASGGFLIIGVLEENGIPKAVVPVKIIDPDAEINRIENLIRDGIAPRIQGIKIKIIAFEKDSYVIAIYIPKSWRLPHRVIYQKQDKFFARHSSGKYSLDIEELRSAFSLSESGLEKIRSFKLNRIAKILSGEDLPVQIQTGLPKIVIHLIPFSSSPSGSINIAKVREDRSLLRPLNSYSGSRLNFDGLVTYSQSQRDYCHDYLQLFRDGSIEVVNSSILSWKGERKLIPSFDFEKDILEGLKGYLSFLKKYGINLPIFAMLSLLNVKGYQMGVSSRYYFDQSPIERDMLIAPEVVLEEYAENIDELMRPTFESIWNACGWSKSLYYDEKTGKRIGQ